MRSGPSPLRRLLTLLAALTVLGQLWAPLSHAAAPTPEAVWICTAEGEGVVHLVDGEPVDPRDHVFRPGCPDCVQVSAAVLPAPSPGAPLPRVRPAASPRPVEADAPHACARGPPRPPVRGPPARS